jgi:hypothetical protein
MEDKSYKNYNPAPLPDCDVQMGPKPPPRPAGKRPGTKVPRRRPPVKSIRDLTPGDAERIRFFRRRGMSKAGIREIYRLSKGQLKRVLRGGPCPQKEDECSRM